MNQENREVRSYNARVQVIRKTITHADLTSDVDNTAFAVAVGTLPAGAVVLGQSYRLGANFTGGGLSAVGLELGYTADPDAILSSVSVFSGTAAAYKKGTAGVLIKVEVATDIVATFTPDASHDVEDATAGSVDVEVYFCVPDQSTAG